MSFNFPISRRIVLEDPYHLLTDDLRESNRHARMHPTKQPTTPELVGPSWDRRAIKVITEGSVAALVARIPNHPLQDKIDELGRAIERKFAPLKMFSLMLDSNGGDDWYKQLATFLIKLPARVVRNIIRLLYTILKTALTTAVHPLESILKLAKFLVRLAKELSKPETWTKMGAGALGASLGQFTVTGNPFALMGGAIGGALMLGGLSIGALKAAIEAENGKLDAVKGELWKQAKALPESLLTGFILGLIFGGIQKAVQPPKLGPADLDKVVDWVNKEYLPKHHLPQPTSVSIDPSGVIKMSWTKSELNRLLQLESSFAHKGLSFYHPHQGGAITRYEVVLHDQEWMALNPQMPGSTEVHYGVTSVTFYDKIEVDHFNFMDRLPMTDYPMMQPTQVPGSEPAFSAVSAFGTEASRA